MIGYLEARCAIFFTPDEIVAMARELGAVE